MRFKKLTEDVLLLYAIKHYDNPCCTSIEEFHKDYSTAIYLKRLFNKYKASGEIKEQMVINHIITFYNVFGIEAATRILFLKTDVADYPILKTFLIFLKYLDPVRSYSEWGLDLRIVALDQKIVEKLRGLEKEYT